MIRSSHVSLATILTPLLCGAMWLGATALPLDVFAQTVREDGWCTAVRPAGTSQCVGDPQQACEIQRDEFAPQATLYPYSDRDQWNRKSCNWKVCLLGADCSFVRPAWVTFRCDNDGISSLSPEYRRPLEPGLCLTDAQRERFDECGQVNALMDNYRVQRSIFSNQTAFSHQFACISVKSCQAYFDNGPDGWGGSFVRHVFDSMETEDGLSASVNKPCDPALSGAACYKTKSKRHGLELARAFLGYCLLSSESADEERWDRDHEDFLTRAVNPCFQEVEDNDELGVLGVAEFRAAANNWAPRLRESMQFLCERPNMKLHSDLATAKASTRAMSELDIEDLYSQVLADEGALAVSVDGEFVISVGERRSIRVFGIDESGAEVDLTGASEISYEVLNGIGSVTITPDGVLEARTATSPIDDLLIINVVHVLIKYGDEHGVLQFALIDSDTDGDGLVDSYEESVGFDSQVAQDIWADTDSDGVRDVVETVSGTDPNPNGTSREPGLVGPVEGEPLSETSQVFLWTGNGTRVDEWRLVAGSSPGGSEYHDSGNLFGQVTTTAEGLPGDSSVVYVRLFYRTRGGEWQFVDSVHSADNDGDGVNDDDDDDDDNDGQLDRDEFTCGSDSLNAMSTAPDLDEDGIPDCVENDTDGDGVDDDADAFPRDSGESVDTDGDGTGNNGDTDDDGDGVADADDVFPLDANESIDTDSDGIGDNTDIDDDGDSVRDAGDVCPATILPDEPTRYQQRNRFVATLDGFVDNKGQVGYALALAGGCSGAQIIDILGLGDGHRKFGISKGALKVWIHKVGSR